MPEIKNYKNNDFSVTVNTRMNGIEIVFNDEMTEEMIEEIKDAGFKWSKRQQKWWAYQSEKSNAYAVSLVEKSEAKEIPFDDLSAETKIGKEDFASVLETPAAPPVIELQKGLQAALEENAAVLTEIPLTRNNYNALFPNGTVETPIGTVKLGENQFKKLQQEDRNNLLGAMYETLSNPSLVLEKETLNAESGDFKPVHVYGKSFVHETSEHKRIVESIIIFKSGENISIGTHNKDIARFVRQIKTADQIIYADSEISRVASLILSKGGSPVQLKGINTQALNPKYDKTKLLSTSDLLKEHTEAQTANRATETEAEKALNEETSGKLITEENFDLLGIKKGGVIKDAGSGFYWKITDDGDFSGSIWRCDEKGNFLDITGVSEVQTVGGGIKEILLDNGVADGKLNKPIYLGEVAKNQNLTTVLTDTERHENEAKLPFAERIKLKQEYKSFFERELKGENDVETFKNIANYYTSLSKNLRQVAEEIEPEFPNFVPFPAREALGSLRLKYAEKLPETEEQKKYREMLDRFNSKLGEKIQEEFGYARNGELALKDENPDNEKDAEIAQNKSATEVEKKSVQEEKLSQPKDLFISERHTQNQMRKIREEAKKILAENTDEQISGNPEMLSLLAQYEGGGGLSGEAKRTSAEVLNAFYTPRSVVKAVWQLADYYAPNAKSVLEPSSGIGRFAENRPQNDFTLRELDETSARIAKILHPEANVIQGAFQAQFFDEDGRAVKKDYELPKYDLVIGNPPYGENKSIWAGRGEGKEFARIEEYFLSRAMDSLRDENSVLVFVMPSSFLKSFPDKTKYLIAEKCALIDAYRLPNGAFDTTDVGTDIIVLKKGLCRAEEISGDNFFKAHPEKILGEEYADTDRFGKKVTKIRTRGANMLEDELGKIAEHLKRAVPHKKHRDKLSAAEQFSETGTKSPKHIFKDNAETQNGGEKTAAFETNIQNQKNEERDVALESGFSQLKSSGQKKENNAIMSMQDFCRLYGKNFVKEEISIWQATNWEGIIDRNRLSVDEEGILHTNENYVETEPGKFTHKVLFESGNIAEKIQHYKNEIARFERDIKEYNGRIYNSEKEMWEEADNSKLELYKKNLAALENALPSKIPIERLHFGVNSTLAEEFMVDHINDDGQIEQLNLQESFILWATGNTLQSANKDNHYWRWNIDFATANISEEEFPPNISWYDIIEYIDKKPVKADKVSSWRKSEDEIKADKAQKKKEADEKRMARSETADKLFDKYLHEGLSEKLKEQVESEYNRRFNSYVAPDYAKLPLFIDGMSREKDGKQFKLYDQQIKGAAFLANKGNGLLAYDVGVGKTATGIVANVAQMQTGRSKRPLIIVPNAVYSKWYKDISDLFPNIQINDLYNLNKESTEKYRDSENPHKLVIPENSISLVTYEALKNITFTDHSCENELKEDFSKLLSEDFEGTTRENAQNAEKIKNVIGSASQVKNTGYVFYEDCGWDNITVDEAHNFKNLWTVPRPKNKGESNEFSGIPSGKPSARALKLYGMTQLTQRRNENRNVFLLTATPFTNSPLEVYSMLSYVGRERLIKSGLYSLRDFCNQFAHTKLELGVNSKGEIDQKQVMKNWKELPALQKLLTEYIDKVDGEELKEIIRPKKFSHVQELEMSDLQKKMMEQDIESMNDVANGNSAAVITSMNAMRLALVAPALADPARYAGLTLPGKKELVETSPKLKFVCDSVIEMYKNNPEKGQFIYMPLGKEAHGIVKDYLVAHGLPKESVEIINGEINNSTEKKYKITGKFNDPKDPCKILIGGKNTSEGIDLNGNSFVMYNCSLGWNPSETTQAEGRIWRQGNMQGHVHCCYPVMNDSIDAVLYQKHDEKRSRINELWTYKDGDSLNVEDINPEDLKFDLIKDPDKRAKFILENGIEEKDKDGKITFKFDGTKTIQNELDKVNSRLKSFDEVCEKRIELKKNFIEAEFGIQKYEKNIDDYKSRKLAIPEWLKSEFKDMRKYKTNYEQKLGTISRKLASWGIKTEEDLERFIPTMNEKKHLLEKQLADKRSELPELLKRETLKMNEARRILPSMEQQLKDFTEGIQENLRTMNEVESEIRKERFEEMLSVKWEKGEITTEERSKYIAAGYKKYYEWLNGDIESLESSVKETQPETSFEQNVKKTAESKETQQSAAIISFGESKNFKQLFLFDIDETQHAKRTDNVIEQKENVSETKISDIANSVKAKIIEKTNASDEWVKAHLVVGGIPRQKKCAGVER
ncbi:MAG: SNF2-related protein [Treponema brennaborense]|nr:SNF2-related protein [Treponema brennaborense]